LSRDLVNKEALGRVAEKEDFDKPPHVRALHVNVTGRGDV